MRESDLYQPVHDWLIADGWQVHVETFDADVVAIKDDILRVVELKLHLTQTLINQLHERARWADQVFCAIASEPRSIHYDIGFYGFGLLQIRNGNVKQRRVARPQPWHWHKRNRYRVNKLSGMIEAQPGELAGITSIQRAAQIRKRNGHE